MAQRDQGKKAGKEPAVMAAGAGASLSDEDYFPLGNKSTSDFGDSEQAETAAATQSQDEAEMVRKATEVLGIHHVVSWMQSEIPSLGEQTPYVLMQTEEGRRRVERVLLKIEHGVY